MLELDLVSLPIKKSRLQWFGHAECKYDADWFKQCMKMVSEESRQTGHPRKAWLDCVKKHT